jgi:hypothetical protein
MGRAISNYVSSAAGGARTAAQRMGASRGASARLVGFLNDVQARGAEQALKTLNLQHLAGRPIREVFLGLADHISPSSGTIDEGIAREAFIETIAELTVLGVTDLDALTEAQMQIVFELYATHAILARICNDIGTKAISMPVDAGTALKVQRQISDFIRRGVSDALTRARATTPVLTQPRVQAFVDEVYEEAFAILRAMGAAEANT